MKPKNSYTICCLCFAAFFTFFQSCRKSPVISRANQASTNQNSVAKKSGLVAWYPFNGDVLDHSGNNNNISFNSATATTGKNGLSNNAYFFDGSSSYMTIPNSVSLNPTGGITLAALVEPTGFYQGPCHRNTILYKAFDDNTPGKYLLAFDDMAYYNFLGCNEQVQEDHENFYGSYGDGQATAAGTRDPAKKVVAGRWYTVVFTFDGAYAKLYVNGVLRSVNATSTTFSPSNAPVSIGRGPSAQFPYWFTGIIDEIRIYSQALSAPEIQTLDQNFQ